MAATFWARLSERTILQAAGVAAAKLSLPLPAGKRLHVHLSPGDTAKWKDWLVGGPTCMALASLVTGVPTRDDVAVTGRYFPPGALGAMRLPGEGVWENAATTQGLRVVVMGPTDGVVQEAADQGLSVEVAEVMSAALPHVLAVPGQNG